MTRQRTGILAEKTVKVVKPRNREEAIIQENVVMALKTYGRHDIEWHHVPNGIELSWKIAKEIKAMGATSGVADLMLLIDGKSHALELKTETGSQSSAQEEWQMCHERAGGVYHLAFGFYQALGVLAAINALRPGVTLSSALGKGARKGEGGRSSPLPPTSSPERPALPRSGNDGTADRRAGHS